MSLTLVYLNYDIYDISLFLNKLAMVYIIDIAFYEISIYLLMLFLKTVVEFIKPFGKNAKQVNVRFLKENDGKIGDLSKKDKVKKAKGI